MQNEMIDNVYVSLGLKVRERRNSLGYTQEELAEMTGLNRVSLAKLEKGKQRILFHDAVKLSTLLGISIDELKDQLTSSIIDQKYKEQPKAVQKQLNKLGIFGARK